jgi:hypothetical protein
MREAAIRIPQTGTLAMDRTFKFVFNSNMIAAIGTQLCEMWFFGALVASRRLSEHRYDQQNGAGVLRLLLFFKSSKGGANRHEYFNLLIGQRRAEFPPTKGLKGTNSVR